LKRQISHCPSKIVSGTSAPNHFLADRMLGKLARYLRMIGCDTSYPPPSTDRELMARARKESRILLTRDTGIGESESVRRGRPVVVEIRCDDVRGQLRQMAAEGWVKAIESPRCPLCNTQPEYMPLGEARHLLYPFTVANQAAFFYCPSCNIMLWEGSHWEHFREMISGIFPSV
jgi:uncharacterized protein with PIN domain